MGRSCDAEGDLQREQRPAQKTEKNVTNLPTTSGDGLLRDATLEKELLRKRAQDQHDKVHKL